MTVQGLTNGLGSDQRRAPSVAAGIDAFPSHSTWRTVERLLSAFDAQLEVKFRGADGKIARVKLETAMAGDSAAS